MEPWERLKRYVNASEVDDELVRESWNQAKALVDTFVGQADVPAPILDLAYVQTGSELFARRSAPSGVSQFATGGENPVRLARDPMTGTYPLLRRFVGWGIA